ncbi:MAG: hypothetical protein UEF48_01010, partial [Agathobaculum butyriciproducens]|nr:hypothetical protein [Agathobaculum butyriciproducens]
SAENRLIPRWNTRSTHEHCTKNKGRIRRKSEDSLEKIRVLRCQKKNAIPIEIDLSGQNDNPFEKSRAHHWHRLCYSRYYTMFNCKAYSSNCQEKDKLTYAVFGVF